MASQKVLTLTLNPALDVATQVDRVVEEHKLRCDEPTYDPGGGGVNVARVLHRLGAEVTAFFTAGGHTGEALKSCLKAEGVTGWPHSIRGNTRQNFTVKEKTSDRQYRFVLPGPTIEENVWRSCLREIRFLARQMNWIVMSGSLPPGVPPEFCSQVVALSKEQGVPLVVDTSGPALEAVLKEGGVFLIKPNEKEFDELERNMGLNEAEIVGRGMAKIVVKSMGEKGALWFSQGHRYRMKSPPIEVRSTVGAGDSFVGGMVHALLQGWPEERVFQWGMAAALSTLLSPGTEITRREDMDRLVSELRVETVGI